MTDVPQIYRILPEVILTITGVVIMLAEPLLAKNASRKPLGWLAVLGTLAALASSHWQLGLPAGTAFFGTVQTDAFSVFFHVLIAGIVLVALTVVVAVALIAVLLSAALVAVTMAGRRGFFGVGLALGLSGFGRFIAFEALLFVMLFPAALRVSAAVVVAIAVASAATIAPAGAALFVDVLGEHSEFPGQCRTDAGLCTARAE